jgi:hypothetical protein
LEFIACGVTPTALLCDSVSLLPAFDKLLHGLAERTDPSRNSQNVWVMSN